MWYVVWRGRVSDSHDFQSAIKMAKIYTFGEDEYYIALICHYDAKAREIKLWAMYWLVDDVYVLDRINI